MNAIELGKINKIYKTGILTVQVLFDVDLVVREGEMTAIMGPSGSGKSSLMNLIGLLDRPTSGLVQISGQPVEMTMSDRALAALRSEKIGFVFQSFNLLPRLTAMDNVLLPTMYRTKGKIDRAQRATELLSQVGLADRVKHKPTELSGGEKQRVAIARALINDPDIILADEPTGNLDSKSGAEVMQILHKLNSVGKTVIIITHDDTIAKHCGRQVRLVDGRIQS